MPLLLLSTEVFEVFELLDYTESSTVGSSRCPTLRKTSSNVEMEIP